MVENGASKVIDKFKQSIDNAPSENMSALEKKLKESLTISRNQYEEGSDTITTEQVIDEFIKKIAVSTEEPVEFYGKIQSKNGNMIDIVFKFYDKKCEVVSALFPQPFYIVISPSMGKGLEGRIYTVREFFNLAIIANKLEGTITFI